MSREKKYFTKKDDRPVMPRILIVFLMALVVFGVIVALFDVNFYSLKKLGIYCVRIVTPL